MGDPWAPKGGYGCPEAVGRLDWGLAANALCESNKQNARFPTILCSAAALPAWLAMNMSGP